MSNYIPHLYIVLFTYPCPNPIEYILTVDNMVRASLCPAVIRCQLTSPITFRIPDNKVHGAIMGPTWLMSAPDGPHVGPTNLDIRDYFTGTGGDRRYPNRKWNNPKEHGQNRNKAQQNSVYMWCDVLCLYFHRGLISGYWVNTQQDLPSSLENPQPFKKNFQR